MVLRGILLVLAIIGGALLATEMPPSIDVLPLPASAQVVRMLLRVRFEGDYDLLISMAKIGNEVGLTSETVPCDLALRVDRHGRPVLSEAIHSITRHSEIGYQHTQQYSADQPFHLKAGTYDVSIAGGVSCVVATARGASVTIEKQEREHILGSLIRAFAARALIVIGLLGLIMLAFRSRANQGLERP